MRYLEMEWAASDAYVIITEVICIASCVLKSLRRQGHMCRAWDKLSGRVVTRHLTGLAINPTAACCSNPVSVLHVLYEADTVLYTKPRHMKEGVGRTGYWRTLSGCQRYQDLSLFVPRNREANGRRSQTLWAATQGDPWRQLSQLQQGLMPCLTTLGACPALWRCTRLT